MTPPPSPHELFGRLGGRRATVVTGMALAAALGVGLGLWARPSAEAAPEPELVVDDPPVLAEGLQIVVDDRPAPTGPPLVVLPSAQHDGPAWPSRALMTAGVEEAASPAQVVVLSKRQPAPARSKPVKTPPPPAKLAAAKPRIVVADARSKPAKSAPSRLAKAKPPPTETAKAKAADRKKAVQLAKAERKPTRTEKPVRVEAAEAKPPRRPPVRSEAPRRVAKADPCALSDRAEAMVCADSRLSARDRQMRRAYREAELAGAPKAVLRRQQTRWLAARAAAAREAPWAVEDVYLARIAELNDLADDAREN